ncbi:MAG: sigma-54 dependent transcriptional regulator [Vicinamibacterales bacterium]|jgi:two-component system nitrogen regulation response regulator NtrX|nr:Fis family transcriptional regulator [Acidobacteriota bacterium]MDP7471808.1 sigma-54 dependent transcriptional regulator [Vicinamibacterales bacterium]MDP7671560.1 sigma-54 dependent transcriptional regulator [Vicinamibacterales bacterium]HJO38391.1 sigma-54 dependent transcriptional regulator [Vicinamibacterales bacterium]|tara:strand:+ start:480 stop:1853 length:1374 start_codon:yes stop_codon:yes gene_type:complete
MKKARVLVVDDEAAIRESLRMILEYEGYECLQAPTGQDGVDLASRETPDCVFLDIKMPGMDGLEALKQIKVAVEHLPVAVISGHGTPATGFEAGELGAFMFIEKPLQREHVLSAARSMLEQRRLRSENVDLRKEIELRHELVGESAGLAQVTEAVRKAAPTSATVLIVGESGVGKELVARAIHRNSLRSRERFVQVNCAAIPDDLLESELFGHEKGSFTGATDKQTGKFEQADRGTIFLDEVGDMSLRSQAKVLRALQEGEIERVGSTRVVKVDARVIAATNKALEQEIEEGRFREDLYFRLNVVPIPVPPLRDRTDDIPLLVRHFAAAFTRENNFKPLTFSEGAVEALQAHRWRGNARELRNTVEHLMIMASGETIDAADVRARLQVDGRLAGADNGPERPGTLREFKEVAERNFLVDKLREHGWNISKTAEVIDTPRSNLYKKLEQYQISQEQDG